MALYLNQSKRNPSTGKIEKTGALVKVADKRIPLAQRVVSNGNNLSSSNNTTQTTPVSVSNAPAPAGAIGQRADGTYIFPTPPSDAIGQRADGTYILAPSSTSPSSATKGGAGTLPNLSPVDVARGLLAGYEATRDRAVSGVVDKVQDAGTSLITGLIDLNDKAKDFTDKYAPTPQNVGEWTGDAIEGAGSVAGKTVANAVNPVLIPLLLVVGVYAFASK